MECRIHSFSFAIITALSLQPVFAQGSGYGASIRAEMHIPTQQECIDALNTGQALGVARDGRLMVVKADIVYWLDVTPTYIDCEAAKFPPKS